MEICPLDSGKELAIIHRPLGPLMSSKEPDLPAQEVFCWTGETELEPSNRPKRGAKPVQKTDEEIMHMSVQVCAWLIARVKGRWRSRQPLQDGKAWFRSHSSLQTWTRQQQLTLSLRAVFRHRSVPCFSCHQHSLPIRIKYRWAFLMGPDWIDGL